jgi:hypothetical protein
LAAFFFAMNGLTSLRWSHTPAVVRRYFFFFFLAAFFFAIESFTSFHRLRQ